MTSHLVLHRSDAMGLLNKHDKINVKLDKTTYTAGETVTGEIRLKVVDSMKCDGYSCLSGVAVSKRLISHVAYSCRVESQRTRVSRMVTNEGRRPQRF